ncbi:URC4/urg3 family protein [Marinivivus vitaminiproducens]|uniref:URC4/urg3 family protein n=1 Tax=Marinivivus vitaminiproducens TaxID=3035935 RepID=UPI00279DC0A7|nr:URC4/urg3 family protein [Geminicoccaceae bacterium SCSIO 64248]
MTEAVDWLRRPETIRSRCHLLLDRAEAGRLGHFTIAPERFGDAVDCVLDTIAANYPSLRIPYHSRWRHFTVGGRARAEGVFEAAAGRDPGALLRARFDLVVTSVLLDAGAGADWSYVAQDGQRFARSEGLAVASLEAFASGLFSADPDDPLRADGRKLATLSAEELATAFQAGPANPLVGLEGRAGLMQALGLRVSSAPEWFGAEGRVGRLVDAMIDPEGGSAVSAGRILATVLQALGPIWPGRIVVDGVNLGDVGRHPLAGDGGPGEGLVPFHKLSQWLTYSLIEPLQAAGIDVTGLAVLTGLPEYRNGGLMIDSGLVVPRDPTLLARPLRPDEEPIVEWRALTVALLDRIADAVRLRLGRDEHGLPLAAVLEGGTWAAGRRLAALRRAGGAPPITLDSDGTVF